MWQKKLGFGSDILFTARGQILVCDKTGVFMYNSNGKLITSKNSRNEFGPWPCGITYDWHSLQNIIVIDGQLHLLFLSDQDLTTEKRISLENKRKVLKPLSRIAVLSDGSSVVSMFHRKTYKFHIDIGMK